ncbi:hypothetical protein BJ912DRAFT_934338 [Pholiota molesta]|nr:hypothetical protein BJ912DRAFT_934338 [Pholiota molesta]
MWMIHRKRTLGSRPLRQLTVTYLLEARKLGRRLQLASHVGIECSVIDNSVAGPSHGQWRIDGSRRKRNPIMMRYDLCTGARHHANVVNPAPRTRTRSIRKFGGGLSIYYALVICNGQNTYLHTAKEATPGSTMAKKQRDDHEGLCSQCVPNWHPPSEDIHGENWQLEETQTEVWGGSCVYKSTHKYGNDTFSIAIYKVRFQKENGKIPHTIDPSVSSGVPNSLPTVHILSWSAGPARSTQILLGNLFQGFSRVPLGPTSGYLESLSFQPRDRTDAFD